MNTKTLNKIQSAAAFLCTVEAKKSAPYLDAPYRTALQILEALADGQPKNCEAIARQVPHELRSGRAGETTPAWTTVNKVLLELQKGGIIFDVTGTNPKTRSWKLPKGKAKISIQTRKNPT